MLNKGNSMKKWWMACAMWLVTGVAFAGLAPDQLVKKTADDVIDVIKSDKDIQAGNQQKIFTLAEEKILPNFDFDKVSRLVLGKNWTKATPEQQASFQAEIKTWL
jgi:phospholipid transport system substrate-binding protein